MSLLNESRLTLKLALPLIIGQISQMLLGVADTIMIGRLGVLELATLTFANSLFYVPFVFGIGILTSISVFTSNAWGANDDAAGRASCRHGFYLATALGVVLFLLACLLSQYLEIFQQPAEVQAMTGSYFLILMSSVVPALMSLALKNHSDALDRPWPAFWIFLGGVVLNIFLNWIMIYGNLGCPQLGMNGGAYATLISRFAILVGMLVWLHRAPGLRKWVPYHWFKRPILADLKKLLGIGIPASLQMLCEVSAFSAAGLMMGRFGEEAMASYQIALMCAGTAFMVPLGLSMALSVRIGAASGADEQGRLRAIAASGWFLSGVYAILSVIAFSFFGKAMAQSFTDETAVIHLAASMLLVVGVFQLFDGLQVCSASMLRGLQDARMPALMGFFAYWIVGIPVATLLSSKLNFGPLSVWWGLAIGLFIASALLVPRLWKLSAPRRMS